MLLALLVSAVGGVDPEQLPPSCTSFCDSSFGTAIGRDYAGVTAYSNCNDNCVSNVDNYVPQPHTKVYSGMQYQCVEYARRHLIIAQGLTFASVDYAWQIFNLTSTQSANPPATSHSFPGFTNSLSTELPRVGCLLIYDDTAWVTGHVAVIVGVVAPTASAAGIVALAEQNWDSHVWINSMYSRTLPLRQDPSSKAFSILDDYVMGWKCAKW